LREDEMARRVYFAFHYQRDIFRVNEIRNSWVAQAREAAGFYDSFLWENEQAKGDDAIKRLIANDLKGTSVTVVLIGAETSKRKWVNYEIIESYKRGNGILGIYIHNIKDVWSKTDCKGANPFDSIYTAEKGFPRYFSNIYKTYDWVFEFGNKNIGNWVEEAASNAGK
jgi:hypothetical protein